MKKPCCLCDKPLGALAFKTVLRDGVVCATCRAEARINNFDNGTGFTIERLKEYIKLRTPLVNSFD